MFKQPKMRQAGLIVVAVALILIVPNLTRFVG
jgi:competence protein ComGC